MRAVHYNSPVKTSRLSFTLLDTGELYSSAVRQARHSPVILATTLKFTDSTQREKFNTQDKGLRINVSRVTCPTQREPEREREVGGGGVDSQDKGLRMNASERMNE